eukprot:2072349-Pyramimonas_sp.AAC.1
MEASIESLGRLSACHGLLEECYAAFCKSFHATGEAANGFPEASADADGEGGQGGAAADGVGAEPGGPAPDSWQKENALRRRLGM